MTKGDQNNNMMDNEVVFEADITLNESIVSSSSSYVIDEVQEVGFGIFTELKRLSFMIEGGEESFETLVFMIIKMKSLVDEYKRSKEVYIEKVNCMTLKMEDMELQLKKEKSFRRDTLEKLDTSHEELEEEKSRLVIQLQRLEHLPSVVKRLELENKDWSDEVHSLQTRLDILQKLYDQETVKSKSLIQEKRRSSIGRSSLGLSQAIDESVNDMNCMTSLFTLPLSMELQSTPKVKKIKPVTRETQTDPVVEEDDDDFEVVEDMTQLREKKASQNFCRWKILYVLLSLACLSNVFEVIVDPVYDSWETILGFSNWAGPKEGRFVPM